MKLNVTDIDNVITNADLTDGNLILLASRPGVGKTQTCIEIINNFKDKYDYLYFDLSVGGTRFWERKGLKIDKEYKSSLEIIKALEKFVKNDRAKFVVIDYWQLVEDKNDWFLRKLMEFTWEYKLIIFITSQLVRNVEKRKNHLPKRKDFNDIKNLSKFARKVLVIDRPAMYGEDVEDKLEYCIYKDKDNNYLKQD